MEAQKGGNMDSEAKHISEPLISILDAISRVFNDVEDGPVGQWLKRLQDESHKHTQDRTRRTETRQGGQ